MTGKTVSNRGMILIPVLILTVTIAGIAGLAALSRHGSLAEGRIHLEKTRAQYFAHGGAADALARVSGLIKDAIQPDGKPNVTNYDYGEAAYFILDTAGMLDVNQASEEDLRELFRDAELHSPGELSTAIVEARSTNAGPVHWPLRTLGEMLRIPGITQDVFWGSLEQHCLYDRTDTSRKYVHKAAMMNLITVYDGSRTLNEAKKRRLTSSYTQGHTYRILSLGRSGGSSALLWITVRKVSSNVCGYIVLHRRWL